MKQKGEIGPITFKTIEKKLKIRFAIFSFIKLKPFPYLSVKTSKGELSMKKLAITLLILVSVMELAAGCSAPKERDKNVETSSI